jgi:hypothetical protein
MPQKDSAEKAARDIRRSAVASTSRHQFCVSVSKCPISLR